MICTNHHIWSTIIFQDRGIVKTWHYLENYSILSTEHLLKDLTKVEVIDNSTFSYHHHHHDHHDDQLVSGLGSQGRAPFTVNYYFWERICPREVSSDSLKCIKYIYASYGSTFIYFTMICHELLNEFVLFNVILFFWGPCSWPLLFSLILIIYTSLIVTNRSELWLISTYCR